MTKLMDVETGEVFTEGNNINEIMEVLNEDSGDWSYYYRSDCSMVDAYFCETEDSGKLDCDGENADTIYEVIED
jgi:hypothetical protein